MLLSSGLIDLSMVRKVAAESAPAASGLASMRFERRVVRPSRTDATRHARAGVTALGHIDAAIRLFDPNADLEDINPRLPPRHQAFKGEVSRLVLNALGKSAKPLPVSELTLIVLAGRGSSADDKPFLRILSGRVGACLRNLRKKKEGPGQDDAAGRKPWTLGNCSVDGREICGIRGGKSCTREFLFRHFLYSSQYVMRTRMDIVEFYSTNQRNTNPFSQRRLLLIPVSFSETRGWIAAQSVRRPGTVLSQPAS